MTIFTQHPHDQGISYFEHWAFAMGIAWRLLRSVIAFALHAVLPCIGIEKKLDLEATSTYLLNRNDFIEAAANAGSALNARLTTHQRRYGGIRIRVY